MYYKLTLDRFPNIDQSYTVTRNTVWQIADKHHILIFIREGICNLSCAGENYRLKKGDIVYIPRNHSYIRSSIDGIMCTMTYLHFDLPGEIDELDSSDLYRELSTLKKNHDESILSNTSFCSIYHDLFLKSHYSLSDSSPLFALLDNIRHYSTRRQLTSGLQSSIDLCSILSRLSQCTIEEVTTETLQDSHNNVPTKLKKAIHYIRGHYSEQISLADLAKRCNLSPQQIIRYFHSAFHTTPIAYIMDYKVAKAKDLLFNQPELTIKEISAELGFSDQHYFSKAFTKITGESPSEYRYRISHYDESAAEQKGKEADASE